MNCAVASVEFCVFTLVPLAVHSKSMLPGQKLGVSLSLKEGDLPFVYISCASRRSIGKPGRQVFRLLLPHAGPPVKGFHAASPYGIPPGLTSAPKANPVLFTPQPGDSKVKSCVSSPGETKFAIIARAPFGLQILAASRRDVHKP